MSKQTLKTQTPNYRAAKILLCGIWSCNIDTCVPNDRNVHIWLQSWVSYQLYHRKARENSHSLNNCWRFSDPTLKFLSALKYPVTASLLTHKCTFLILGFHLKKIVPPPPINTMNLYFSDSLVQFYNVIGKLWDAFSKWPQRKYAEKPKIQISVPFVIMA